jgi:hypothetical protein
MVAALDMEVPAVLVGAVMAVVVVRWELPVL